MVSSRYLVLYGALLVGTLSLVSSCSAHRRAMPGRSALLSYVRAVENNQPDQVYAMMDDAYRKRVSKTLFHKLWKTYRPELLADAKKVRLLVEHPDRNKPQKKEEKIGEAASPIRVDATGTVAGKKPVVLSWENGRWVVKSGPGTALAGAGIKGALLALIKVVQAKDFRGFMAMLSEKRREAFWRGVSERLTKLKSWMADGRIRASGDRVRIYYDADSYVDLVREKGVWRIEDFN